jgi:hypothetical protein
MTEIFLSQCSNQRGHVRVAATAARCATPHACKPSGPFHSNPLPQAESNKHPSTCCTVYEFGCHSPALSIPTRRSSRCHTIAWPDCRIAAYLHDFRPSTSIQLSAVHLTPAERSLVFSLLRCTTLFSHLKLAVVVASDPVLRSIRRYSPFAVRCPSADQSFSGLSETRAQYFVLESSVAMRTCSDHILAGLFRRISRQFIDAHILGTVEIGPS